MLTVKNNERVKKKYREGPELGSLKSGNQVLILQSQDLRAGEVKKPCIRLIQENSIENSVQDCLSYTLMTDGPCSTTLTYSK